jgi:ribonuclease E
VPAVSAAEVAAGPAGEVPAEPAPRTRRRRRAATAEESAPAEPTPVTAEAAPVEAAPVTAEAAPVAAAPVTPEAAPVAAKEPAPAEAAPVAVEITPPVVDVVPAGEPATAEEPRVREPAGGRPRRATTAVLFMAPEAAAAEPRPAKRAAGAADEEPAEPATTEAPVETARKRRRGRRTPTEAAAAVEAAEPAVTAPVEEAGAEEEDHELEAETEEPTTGRRRRRRGRRGRGRGKGGVEEHAEEAAPDAAAEEPGEGEEVEGEGEPLTRRRRRRRRKGAGEVEAVPADGVPTVVRIREPRKVTDEVQGVTGSTRLEAKRQRRRDGREQRRTRPPILSESEFLARRESVDRVMVVRQRGDRTQIAVLEDGVLVEHYVSRASSSTMAGNVYLGKVQNVLPSMEAAFVDIGRGRNAVLYAGEVNWDTTGLEGRARSIEQALKAGDSVLVQVTKDPVGHKGARLTSHIALSGRHLVYVPNGNASGISRKLPDTERRRLRDILKKLVPEGAGVIVRTAAEGASEEELARDVKRLQAQWDDIQAKASAGGAPVLLYEEPDLVIRVVRDLFNEDFRELIVQGDGAYDMVEAYLAHVSPDLLDRLHRYTGTGDVFAEKRIDEQILKGLDRKVFLPSGGHLVIDRTEAMTVIDVNTGKYTGAGGNLEETVTRNNLEAAEEIVRQLRLRDLGGIVVIDFIDMVLESNRDLVLRRLTECLGRDRTKHQVTEITSLGLVQMTRKRIGAGLLEAFSETCECCKGRGVIIHTEPVPEKPRGGNNNVAERVKAVASASASVKGESTRRRGRRAATPDLAEAEAGRGATAEAEAAQGATAEAGAGRDAAAEAGTARGATAEAGAGLGATPDLAEAEAARDATAEATVARDALDQAEVVAEPTDLVDVGVESTGSEDAEAAVVDKTDPLASGAPASPEAGLAAMTATEVEDADDQPAGPPDAGPQDAGPHDAEARDGGPLNSAPLNGEPLDGAPLDGEDADDLEGAVSGIRRRIRRGSRRRTRP